MSEQTKQTSSKHENRMVPGETGDVCLFALFALDISLGKYPRSSPIRANKQTLGDMGQFPPYSCGFRVCSEKANTSKQSKHDA